MKLPPQAWQALPGAGAIMAALDVAAGTSRVVGGAVRDALIGLQVSDVDLATRLQPGEVVERLEAAGLKAVPTGIDHGTITAVAPDFVMEVTTLRRDVSTDGRRATVAFTDDWREDAARRDFTFNALSANPVIGEIFDYFGGLEDLRRHHVRFIGSPLERIAEDHLRILRFFRFHARFGEGLPDPEGLAACAARANDLMALSRERIREELLKLLAVADPAPTVRLMVDHGIFSPVLPEIGPESVAGLAATVEAERKAGQAASSIRRLAALFPPDPELAADVARRLRLSNAERKRLVTAAGRTPADVTSEPAVLAYRLGLEEAVDRLLLAGAPPASIQKLQGWERPRLAVTGGDLVARGVEKGPQVSALLKAIEDDWVTAGFPPRSSAIEAIVAKRLGQSAAEKPSNSPDTQGNPRR